MTSQFWQWDLLLVSSLDDTVRTPQEEKKSNNLKHLSYTWLFSQRSSHSSVSERRIRLVAILLDIPTKDIMEYEEIILNENISA